MLAMGIAGAFLVLNVRVLHKLCACETDSTLHRCFTSYLANRNGPWANLKKASGSQFFSKSSGPRFDCLDGSRSRMIKEKVLEG